MEPGEKTEGDLNNAYKYIRTGVKRMEASSLQWHPVIVKGPVGTNTGSSI